MLYLLCLHYIITNLLQERPKMLFEKFLKEVSDLSIADEECMKVEVKKLQTDTPNMKISRDRIIRKR